MLEASQDGQVIDWPAITELRLPNLTSVGGELFIYRTDALIETDFRSLESVGTRVYIHRNLVLQRIGLGSLSDAPDVHVSANPEFPECELQALCDRLGSATCGAFGFGREDCSCASRCGVLEAMCP